MANRWGNMASRWGNNGNSERVYFLGLQNHSLQMVSAAMKSKDTCTLEESYDQPRQHIKKQRHYFADRGLSSQSCGFSSSHVMRWLDGITDSVDMSWSKLCKLNWVRVVAPTPPWSNYRRWIFTLLLPIRIWELNLWGGNVTGGKEAGHNFWKPKNTT